MIFFINRSDKVMRKYDVIPITINNIQSQAEGGLQKWKHKCTRATKNIE